MNEKKTENIVRDYFRKHGYYKDSNIIVEEQQSDNPRIKKLLKNASKKGTKGGYPKFIVTSKQYSDFVIIVECKANVSKHESKTKDHYADYAVDGVLLYASYLKKEFDVIAIAVSGETKKHIKINHFLCLKGQPKEIPSFGNNILSFENYYENYINNPIKFNQDYLALLKYSEKLNETLHLNKISESDRAFFISGVLIALQDKAFKQSYESESTYDSLSERLVGTIKTHLTNSRIASDKIKNIESQFLFIKSNISFSQNKTILI